MSTPESKIQSELLPDSLVEQRRKKPSLKLVKRDAKAEQARADANRQQRLWEEALAVEAEDAKTSGNIGFVAKWLVHATLPYVQPKGDPPAWGRRSGNVSLVIQPGYVHKDVEKVDARGKKYIASELVCIGYPYGAYPRLILAWIATEVVKKRERELQLGTSLSEFMTSLGKDTISGGARGTITLLKNQMQRLFSANISVSNDPDAVQWRSDGFRIVDSASIETWWDPLSAAEPMLWQSNLKLTERFYETIAQNPVPIDLRILKALSRSAMAMDIYCWLTYRNAIIERSTKVPWEGLQLQFGSNASKYKFRENFERNLKDVLGLYPQAKVVADSSGLLLIPSPPSISKRIAG